MTRWRGKGCGRLLEVLLEANELKAIPRYAFEHGLVCLTVKVDALAVDAERR